MATSTRPARTREAPGRPNESPPTGAEPDEGRGGGPGEDASESSTPDPLLGWLQLGRPTRAKGQRARGRR